MLLGRMNGAIFKAQGWETRPVKPVLWESRCRKALRFLGCELGITRQGSSKDGWSVHTVLAGPGVGSAVGAQTGRSDPPHQCCWLQPYPTFRQALGGCFADPCFVASAVPAPQAAAPCSRVPGREERAEATSQPSHVCCQYGFCEMSETPQVLK